MPEWLKKLLKALKIDASLFKADVENLNVTITNSPASPPTFTYDKASGKLEINFAGMTPEQIQAAKSVLSESFFNGGQAFIENKSSERITELRLSESERKNRLILEAFRPIISPEDFLALRSALFLRKEFDAGREVYLLKEQVMQRFGERGGRIANLCSAGYFDNFPSELEKAKTLKGFSYDKVRKEFERFVEHSAFAIFIKSGESASMTRKYIIDKICTNATYGLKRLVVHGIGAGNSEKIEAVVRALIKKHPRIAMSYDDSVGDTINILLEFPTDIVKELKP